MSRLVQFDLPPIAFYLVLVIAQQGGFRLLANFLSTAGMVVDRGLLKQLDRSVCEQAGCVTTALDGNETRVVTF